MALPVSELFAPLPEIPLDEVQTRMYLNGVRLDAERLLKCAPVDELARVTAGRGVLGVGKIKAEGELFRSSSSARNKNTGYPV